MSVKMDGVTPAERRFRTLSVCIREILFPALVPCEKLQIACEFLGYPFNPPGGCWGFVRCLQWQCFLQICLAQVEGDSKCSDPTGRSL